MKTNETSKPVDRRKTRVLRRQLGETLTDYTLRFMAHHGYGASNLPTIEELCTDNVTDRRHDKR